MLTEEVRTHTRSMQAHSQSEGNELMESQRTALGVKANQLVVGQKGRERERQREFGTVESRRKRQENRDRE